MKLDLDRQEFGRSELDVRGSLPLEMGEGTCAEAAVDGTLVVQNLGKRFLLDGALRAEGVADCARCLRPFPLTWDVPVEIMVLRDVDSQETEGETLLILQQAGEVDLRESIRECVVLAYPQAPVCAPDCRGLCPQCGVDRNQTTCGCSEDVVDPRWDALP
jgi:uncharacterized protein